MIDDSTRRRFVAGVASVRVATLSGCLGGRPEDTGSSGTSGERRERAETTAGATATATNAVQTVGTAARERLDDRARYARGRELSVEGRVDVDDLPALATADAVAHVRPPRKPVADGATASIHGGA